MLRWLITAGLKFIIMVDNAMIPKNNDMRFEVTTRCNYNCGICPRGKLTRKIETMSLELFKKLFEKINRQTRQYDTLTFPGMGEPLLDQTLEKKIEFAKKRRNDLSVLLLSNGSLLTPGYFKRLENLGVASIRISCYGTDAHSYNKAHGVKDKNAFNVVRDNLIKICKLKESMKVLLTFNVTDNCNHGLVQDWIDFWKDKVDLIEVWRPHNWVDAVNCRKVQKDKLNTCGRPFKGPLQIQVDGTVNMCCFDFDGKLTLGDLKKQTLKEIFSSDLYKKIVRCHKSGNFRASNLICENCDQLNKDKSEVMIYNSRFNIAERVKMTSTTYKKCID